MLLMNDMYNIDVNKRVGRGKQYEDFYDFVNYGEKKLLVVLADGMGGTDCARDAAVFVVRTIIDNYVNDNCIEDQLQKVILLANDNIADKCIERKCKMGCAIAVVYIKDHNLWYVSLGNVHINIYTNGIETCVTQDDVFVASNGNEFLTRSISGKNIEGKVDVKKCNIIGVERIVLATDGAYKQNEFDDATEVIITYE